MSRLFNIVFLGFIVFSLFTPFLTVNAESVTSQKDNVIRIREPFPNSFVNEDKNTQQSKESTSNKPDSKNVLNIPASILKVITFISLLGIILGGIMTLVSVFVISWRKYSKAIFSYSIIGLVTIIAIILFIGFFNPLISFPFFTFFEQ